MRKIIIKHLKKIAQAMLKAYYIFPVDTKKVFLMNFEGTIIGHDAKAFADWCIEQGAELDLVWGSSKEDMEYDGIRFVNKTSLKGIYEIMTAKAVIYNINVPSYIPFRDGQVLINTWHGYPFKRVGKYTTPLNECSFSKATAFISHSKEYTEFCIEDSLGFWGDVLNCGAPRNDIFFSPKANVVKNTIKTLYQVENKNIVLYVPTFRDGLDNLNAHLDFSTLVSSLEMKFGGKWVVFAKIHPSRVEKNCFSDEHVIDVSKHQDTQELLCAADVLITDYSSAMWDFSLQKKPVFVYADDLDWYKKRRGLYKPVEEWPYPVAQNNQELEMIISKFNEKEYVERLTSYFEEIGCYEEGVSSKIIYDYILAGIQ